MNLRRKTLTLDVPLPVSATSAPQTPKKSSVAIRLQLALTGRGRRNVNRKRCRLVKNVHNSLQFFGCKETSLWTANERLVTDDFDSFQRLFILRRSAGGERSPLVLTRGQVFAGNYSHRREQPRRCQHKPFQCERCGGEGVTKDGGHCPKKDLVATASSPSQQSKKVVHCITD